MNRRDISARPDSYKVSMEIGVRFRDLDAMGHVNNATYFTYLEMGRVAYMRALGKGAELAELASRFPFVLADAYCCYLSAAGLDERLRVHTRTSRVGGKSFDFEYLITSVRDGRAIAVGHSTQVCYDWATGRTLPVSAALRAAIESLEGRTL